MGLDVAICDEGLAPWATSAGKTVRTQVRNAVVASTRGRRCTNLMVPEVGRALSVGGITRRRLGSFNHFRKLKRCWVADSTTKCKVGK